MNLGPADTHGATDAFVRPAEAITDREANDFSPFPTSCHSELSKIDRKADDLAESRNLVSSHAIPAHEAADAPSPADSSVRRMLAVLQFSEDDDMAFTLDRMFTRINPMRGRLSSGRCFLRFVVIEDEAQRRSICAALNQWMINSAEKATGLSAAFSSSLEFVARASSPAMTSADALTVPTVTKTNVVSIDRNLDSDAAKNLHCPHPLPSGF
jgi:hypothetical protein